MKIGPLASKRPSRAEIGQSLSTTSPVKGWNTRDPLANMGEAYAVTLDNWLPGTGTVAIRKGCSSWANRALIGAVKTVLPWRGATGEKLFASTDTGIYDATAGGAMGAAVQARTSGYACYVNFTTTGQSYLVTVNGVDDLAYTNGTVWTTNPSMPITGGGTLLTNTIFNVNSFKRSLYFLKNNSMSFFYLPIDSITGTVSEFPLGGLFTKGGKLMAMGTWTVDGGFGADDYSVFITDKGQAAVYKGTDPSTSATWALNGIYDLAAPMGAKCMCHYGGDLLVLTRRGVFSMTKILKDTQLIAGSALSAPIGEAFTQAAIDSGSLEGWEIIEYPEENVIICNVPLTDFLTSYQLVMNTKTGAWCRFKGWDTFSFAYLGSSLYGGFINKVGKMFDTLLDFDASITALVQTAFNYYSPRSRIKSWKLVRPNLILSGPVAINVALVTGFFGEVHYDSAIVGTVLSARWDMSLWDVGQWSTELVSKTEWVTASADDSYCAAIALRVISRDATVLWAATDTIYEPGGLI